MQTSTLARISQLEYAQETAERLVCGEIAHLMQGDASLVHTVVKPYLHFTLQPDLK